jgi:hypothetical protein
MEQGRTYHLVWLDKQDGVTDFPSESSFWPADVYVTLSFAGTDGIIIRPVDSGYTHPLEFTPEAGGYYVLSVAAYEPDTAGYFGLAYY